MKPVITFDNVSKRYRIGRTAPSLRSMMKGMHSPQSEKYHWALKNVGFELRPGESLGIIGPNGAGKTTTLKLLSKVTYPTSGAIRVNGRFSSLIELGAGFHPDLTGRENIYLNGTILGMRKSEINARFNNIVDFADIGDYLDTPVKRYSSGMYARLGFAVAVHVDPEILLVDEVLAVGDMAFRTKCYERMLQLLRKGTALIFVSHNFDDIQRVCSRCMVLYRGSTAFEGDAAEATAQYSNILRKAASNTNRESLPDGEALSQMVMTHEAVIEDVNIFNSEGMPAITFVSGDVVRVRMKVKFNANVRSPVFACTIRSSNGLVVYDYTTHWAQLSTPDFEANSVAEIEFTLALLLTSGTYQLGVDLAYHDLSVYYDRVVRALDFVVTGGNGAGGVANLQAEFNILDTETTR